jgi:hypothetical protein
MHPHFLEFLRIVEEGAAKYGLSDKTPLLNDIDQTVQIGGLTQIVRVWEGEGGKITIESYIDVQSGNNYLCIKYNGKGHGGTARLEPGDVCPKATASTGILQRLEWYEVAEGLPRAASGKK